ncbi:MAG: diguanylate cyclase [Rhizobiaceae bacterium]
MQNHLTNESKSASVTPLRDYSFDQRNGVLDLLSDGVFLIEDKSSMNSTQCEFIVNYANNALLGMVKKELKCVLQCPLTILFPRFYYSDLYDALEEVKQLGMQRIVDIDYQSGNNNQNLRMVLVPKEQPTGQSEQNVQIVGCVTNITPLAARANYLEGRAAKLINHSKGLETTHRQLEKQVFALENSLKNMERAVRFDVVTGLSNRKYFLEQGAAEFQRSNRYGHSLSILIVMMRDIELLVQAHGLDSINLALTGLTQICETAFRGGTDLGGRIAENEIVILLPETNLTGALKFNERLNELISSTPIQLKNGFVRLGITASVDTMQDEDQGFMQMLVRGQTAISS